MAECGPPYDQIGGLQPPGRRAMDMATTLAELGVTASSFDSDTRQRLDRDGYAALPGIGPAGARYAHALFHGPAHPVVDSEVLLAKSLRRYHSRALSR